MNAAVQKNKVRTAAQRMLAGAVVGGIATFLFLEFVGERFMDLDDGAVMLTVMAGLIYALIGLSVAFGLVAPRAGARFLNVEDAEELREEGPKLKIGAAASVLMGAFLLVLGLSSSGSLGREPALVLLALCLGGAIVLTLIGRKRTDELTRQISLESSALTLQLALLAAAVWAALAQLGYVEWISPLGLLSGLALLQLVAVFMVSARKGLLLR
jgi:hypothetical protein